MALSVMHSFQSYLIVKHKIYVSLFFCFHPRKHSFILIHSSLLGRSWAATTTEGLLVYSLDSGLIFDPFDLDIDVTPSNIRKKLQQKEYTVAIIMAFKLNEKKLIQEVIEAVPSSEGEWISCET